MAELNQLLAEIDESSGASWNPSRPTTPLEETILANWPSLRAILDRAKDEQSRELLEWAWTIIANAGGGDWTKESPEWQHAAERWRDKVHDLFPGMG